MPIWYLSFADEKFLGGCFVVAGDDPQLAHAEATAKGLNPGGSVKMHVVPESFVVPPHLMYVLMGKAMMETLFGSVYNFETGERVE